MRIRLALCLALICAALIWHNSPRSMLQAVAQSALSGNAVATTSMGAAVDQFLTVADVTLRYREVGRGEPVILIHGYARNLDDWDRVADALASTHRVLAMDVRGFGKSSKFADSRRFGALMADDVIRLFDHLRISRAHVVGQSMGALIAAKVAARYPKRVLTATLIAGPFYNAGAESEAEMLAGLKAGKGMTLFLQRTFPEMDARAVTEVSAEILAQNDLPSLIAVMDSLHALDVTAGRTPQMPALVICGTADGLLPDSRQLAAWWPGARLVEVPGANHATVIDRPETLTAMRALMH